MACRTSTRRRARRAGRPRPGSGRAGRVCRTVSAAQPRCSATARHAAACPLGPARPHDGPACRRPARGTRRTRCARLASPWSTWARSLVRASDCRQPRYGETYPKVAGSLSAVRRRHPARRQHPPGSCVRQGRPSSPLLGTIKKVTGRVCRQGACPGLPSGGARSVRRSGPTLARCSHHTASAGLVPVISPWTAVATG
jgi:hypothetical protein